jgi:uncharacterized protein
MRNQTKLPGAVDVFELARGGGVIEGQVPLGATARLRANLHGDSGTIDFRLQGRVDELGRPGAQLLLRTDLPLRCDRCAQPLDLHLEHEGNFYFVHDEDELAALPVTPDDDVEPLLGSTDFDVAALVEDETILSIPISPRHAVCPAPLVDTDKVARKTTQNAFAALPELLRKTGR